MHSAKCKFIQWKISDLNDTNIGFIELYRIAIMIKHHKLLVLYFDKDDLFLYDITMPITIKNLIMVLENIVICDYNFYE